MDLSQLYPYNQQICHHTSFYLFFFATQRKEEKFAISFLLPQSLTSFRYYHRFCNPKICRQLIIKYQLILTMNWSGSDMVNLSISWSSSDLVYALDYYAFFKQMIKISWFRKIYEQDFVNRYSFQQFWNRDLCCLAVQRNNKEFLYDMYLARYTQSNVYSVIWPEYVYFTAVQISSISMITYLYDLDCQILPKYLSRGFITRNWNVNFYIEAIKNNDLEMISWLFHHSCPLNEDLLNIQASIAIWQWLADHQFPYLPIIAEQDNMVE